MGDCETWECYNVGVFGGLAGWIQKVSGWCGWVFLVALGVYRQCTSAGVPEGISSVLGFVSGMINSLSTR